MFKLIKNKSIVVVSLSLMLLLSACGAKPADNDGTDSALPSVNSDKNTELIEQETKIVSTVLGDVEIPVNPKRVACHTWTGDLVALGVIPIVSNDTSLEIIQDELKDSTYALFTDPEEIMSYEPDLIIVRDVTYGDGSSVNAENFQQIAPTISVPYDTPLDERIRLFGEIFDKEEEAEAVLNAFYTKAEQYKEDFKTASIYGKSVGIIFPRDDSFSILGDDNGHGAQVLYYMLDFSVPETIQTEILDKGEQFKKVSLEVVTEFLSDADYLEVSGYTEDALEGLSEKYNPIWDLIPAVKNDNIVKFIGKRYDNKSLYVMDKLLDYYHEQFMQLATH